ncbi:hypothetical protein ALISP_7167 [Alicycliphilus sp. B1]|nr:hypothetical protein ALISP_7167 [Alicycliphilus sp. B1]
MPDWQMNAHGAAERATAAYLAGEDRVAQQEWARARAEVARTGRPGLLARVELMRCAGPGGQPGGTGRARPSSRCAPTPRRPSWPTPTTWPAAPRRPRPRCCPRRSAPLAASVDAIAAISDPLARLVAAGAAMQSGRATPQLLVLASDTAAAQGWRRPLLAWLLLRAQRAQAAGDTRRWPMRSGAASSVIESGGAPAAQAPKN